MVILKDIFEDTYRGKKVFVTGHTGFKGSWLIGWLHALGAEIRGYALNPGNVGDLFYQIKGADLCDSIIADIRDKGQLEKAVTSFQPDFIFHLAAQPLVRLSYQIPVETFETNIIGTVNLLNSLRFLEKACVTIVVTTDKVYENKEWYHPYRESDILGGYDPYSASKACTELAVSSYRNSFFPLNKFDKHNKAISTARAGNVIGGGDFSKDRLIPDIIKALQNNEPIIIRNPHAVRPWQHVLEPLSGYLLLGNLLQKDPFQYSDAWNFGPYNDDTLTVEEIVKKVIEIWGGGTYTIDTNSNHLHEAGLLQLDISKSMNSMKWRPKLNAEKRLAYAIEEYKQLTVGNNNIIFKQIDYFQNLQ